MRYHAVGLSIDAHALLDGPLFLEARDLGPGYAERFQAVAGSLQQRDVAAARRREELFLRVHQRRRVQLKEKLPFSDRVAGRLGDETLNPAVHARVDLLDGALIVSDVADRLDAAHQFAALRPDLAHAKVVDDGWIDLDDAWLVVDLIGVDRHKIHAHGRLAGFIASVVGIHGRNPVKDLPVAAAGGRTGTCRCVIERTPCKKGNDDRRQESGRNE